jgi:pantoate--beta-alanine ligase
MVRALAKEREWGERIGFVPTLGRLHEGHAALIQKAKRENDIVVVSIFVNPLQFKPEAYKAYPRDMKKDDVFLVMLGVDYLFAPEEKQMYPEGFDAQVEVMDLAGRLEGEYIRWHYRGVATVVAKLFNIIQPHKAYFGKKDAHQLAIIRRMVEDLNIPVKIIPVATIRAKDGLALSSRNALLTPEERKAASAIPRALEAIEAKVRQGAADREALTRDLISLLEQEPMIKVDFAAVVDAETLKPDVIGKNTLIHAAVYIGGKRLTDNRVAAKGKRAAGAGP